MKKFKISKMGLIFLFLLASCVEHLSFNDGFCNIAIWVIAIFCSVIIIKGVSCLDI